MVFGGCSVVKHVSRTKTQDDQEGVMSPYPHCQQWSLSRYNVLEAWNTTQSPSRSALDRPHNPKCIHVFRYQGLFNTFKTLSSKLVQPSFPKRLNISNSVTPLTRLVLEVWFPLSPPNINRGHGDSRLWPFWKRSVVLLPYSWFHAPQHRQKKQRTVYGREWISLDASQGFAASSFSTLPWTWPQGAMAGPIHLYPPDRVVGTLLSIWVHWAKGDFSLDSLFSHHTKHMLRSGHLGMWMGCLWSLGILWLVVCSKLSRRLTSICLSAVFACSYQRVCCCLHNRIDPSKTSCQCGHDDLCSGLLHSRHSLCHHAYQTGLLGAAVCVDSSDALGHVSYFMTIVHIGVCTDWLRPGKCFFQLPIFCFQTRCLNNIKE